MIKINRRKQLNDRNKKMSGNESERKREYLEQSYRKRRKEGKVKSKAER